VGILRGTQQFRIAPNPYERIKAGDLLLVEGRVEDILRVKSEAGIEIKPDFELSDALLEDEQTELVEAMLPRGSDFIGRNLKKLRLRERYGVIVLAINRHGVNLMSKMSSLSLKFGDVLLIQGNRKNVEDLSAEGRLLLLEEVSERQARPSKRRWAIVAFAVFLLMSISHIVPLPVAVLVGALILLAARAVRPQEIYEMIDWRLIVLIACMMSFGLAMEKTGADQYLAQLIVRATGRYGSLAVLAGFFLMTIILTQPMSNQAAALVMIPIAIKTALSLGLNPRAFAITVTYAASCSFLTPLEPACVLIYTPGRYRFLDFVKVGSILTILVFAIVMFLVPIFWPLQQ
jgi:di/tricarboxylate transporter